MYQRGIDMTNKINPILTFEQCGILKKLIDDRGYKLCKSNPFNVLDSMTPEAARAEKVALCELSCKLDPHTN